MTWQRFDETATDWSRSHPVVLSDFTARPLVLEWCEPIRGASVLDLGCGEGYTARQLAARGAGRIVGIDLAPEMIARAVATESEAAWGIDYRVGDALDLADIPSSSFDLVSAVFLFDGLSISAMHAVIVEVKRVLRPGGRLVFAVTHPALPFVRVDAPPLYVSAGERGYLGSRDHLFEGRIWRRDGIALPICYRHKTLDDYVFALARSGFTALPEVRELGVREEHIAFDQGFFEPLADVPLHLAFRVPNPESGR